jgi:hypothetical protein
MAGQRTIRSHVRRATGAYRTRARSRKFESSPLRRPLAEVRMAYRAIMSHSVHGSALAVGEGATAEEAVRNMIVDKIHGRVNYPELAPRERMQLLGMKRRFLAELTEADVRAATVGMVVNVHELP